LKFNFIPQCGRLPRGARQHDPEAKQGRYLVLIFTRRIGEEIRIGDDIRVRIIDIKGKQVRLGIEAPPEVIIHREEIYLRINENNNKPREAGNQAEKMTGNLNGPEEADRAD
jgi:carbon storage regulator